MAIAFRNKQDADSSTSSVTSLQVTKPTGTVADDVLIFGAILLDNASRTFTPPSGFSLIINNSGLSAGRLVTYYKVAGGSEGANYTMSWNGIATPAIGCILAYSGVHGSSTIDDSDSVFNSATGANAVIPSVDATGLERMLVSIYATSGSTGSASTWTQPASMNERVDRSNTQFGVGLSMGAADLSLSSSGATGTKTATNSVTTDFAGGQNILLTPDALTSTATPRIGMIGT